MLSIFHNTLFVTYSHYWLFPWGAAFLFDNSNRRLRRFSAGFGLRSKHFPVPRARFEIRFCSDICIHGKKGEKLWKKILTENISLISATGIVNTFPVTQKPIRTISIACSAIALCTFWETAAGGLLCTCQTGTKIAVSVCTRTSMKTIILDSRELITRLELLCPDAHKFPVAS